MEREEQEAIEVEVVSVDGIAPVRPQPEDFSQEDPRAAGWQDWQGWQGRVRQLDMRWWPLWVLLGLVLLFLLFTVGIVVGMLYLVWRIIRGVLSVFTGPGR